MHLQNLDYQKKMEEELLNNIKDTEQVKNVDIEMRNNLKSINVGDGYERFN